MANPDPLTSYDSFLSDWDRLIESTTSFPHRVWLRHADDYAENFVNDRIIYKKIRGHIGQIYSTYEKLFEDKEIMPGDLDKVYSAIKNIGQDDIGNRIRNALFPKSANDSLNAQGLVEHVARWRRFEPYLLEKAQTEFLPNWRIDEELAPKVERLQSTNLKLYESLQNVHFRKNGDSLPTSEFERKSPLAACLRS